MNSIDSGMEACRLTCPAEFSDKSPHEVLMAACKGLRIRLDEVDIEEVVDKGKKYVAEVAKLACGSTLGPDVDKPTIGLNDYENTPHTIEVLKQMHDRGLLPDQIL